MFKAVFNLFLLLFVCVASAQTPVVVPSADESDFPGTSVCNTVTLTNTGAPGFGPYLRLSIPDGLSLDSITLFGASVSANTVGVFPAAPGNQLTDPITGDSVTGPEGETFVIVQPPIGSVTTGGAALEFEICFDIDPTATVNVPLNVSVTPVYEFGDTVTGDNGPIVGAGQNFNITPILVQFEKQASAPEAERPPGPSWPVTYDLVVTVAPNNTIDNLDINDVLPPQFVLDINDVSVVGGVNCVVNSLLNVTCDSVNGTGGNDLVISYTGYYSDVLDESNCSVDSAVNNATLDGLFNANPIPQESATSMVSIENMTIQKSVSPGEVSPGATLTYNLNVQLSDYADASIVTVTDVLPDGVTYIGNVTTNFGAITPTVFPDTPAVGQTTITFDVTAVTGNIANGSNLNISYQSTVDQTYAGGGAVLANDFLTNSVNMGYDLVQGAAACSNASAATTNIIPIDIDKEVITTGPYVPNDTVTYRLTLQVPSGDTNGVVFTDYFPLPVFDVSDIDLTFGNDVRWSPTDTLGLTPTAIVVDLPTNSLRIDWPNISTVSPQVLSVDVDVRVTDDPFADNLSLANLLQVRTENSTATVETAVDPVLVQIRAPELVLTKGVSAASQGVIAPAPSTLPIDGDLTDVDANDQVTFVITVENQGGASAFDVLITDPSISQLVNCTIDSVTDGGGTPLAFTGDLVAGISLSNPLTANDGTIGAPYGTDTALVTMSCDIDAAVEIGSTFTNTATATYASGSGAVSFPAVTDTADVTLLAPTINKTVLSVTPDVDGVNNTVTIGEVIQYQVEITVPEGVATNASLVDLLDNGLTFLSFDSLTASSADLTTDVAGGFANVLSSATQLGTRNGNFDFGNLTNVNTDNNVAETLTVVYSVLVNDVGSNTDGVNRNNRADFITAETSVRDQAPNRRIREPLITMSKNVNPMSADAGDVVTYTVVMSNTGNSPAFDVVISDPISDPNLTLVVGTVSTTDGVITTGNTVGDTSVQVDVPSVLNGSSVTVTFDVLISATAPSGSVLPNTAAAIGSSLPGADPNERDYGPVTDDAQVNIAAATVVKSVLPATSTEQSEGVSGQGNAGLVDLTIGEEVTFEIVATLAEGVSPSVIITDTLPNNASGHMDVVSASVIAEGANLIPTNSFPTGNISPSNVVTFDFGAVTNVPDGVVNSDDQIVVQVTAVVLDETVNEGIEILTNNVLIQYNTGLDVSGSADIEVVEPELTIDKSGSVNTADAGDTIVYTLVIENPASGSSARAFEVDLSDAIPTGLTYAGNLTHDSGLAPVSLMENAGVITASWTDFPLGQTSTISYEVIVENSVIPSQIIQNTADLAWSSLPGANVNERESNTSESHTVTITSSGVEKVVFDTSEASTGTAVNGPEDDVTIGETVTYRITVTVPEGTSPAATMVDQLPNSVAKLHAVSSQIVAIGGNLTVPGGVVGTPGVASDSAPTDGYDDLVTWNLGDIINAPDGLSNTDDQIVFEVVALLVDDPVNQGGLNDVVNTATFTSGANSTIDTALIDVVEPILTIAKETIPNSITADAGDVLTYRLTISHDAASTADAFNLTVNDLLPQPGTSWLGNPVISTCPGLVTDASGDPNILFTIPVLTGATGSCTIEYDLEVDLLVNPNVVYSNTATLEYTSTEIIVPGETRIEQDMDNTDFITASPAIMKVSGNSSLNDTGDNVGDMLLPDLAIGETLDFNLTIILPEGTTPNAVVSDQLPVLGTGGVIELVSATVDTIGANISSTLPGTAVYSDTDFDSINDHVMMDFGTVTNTPDGVVDVNDQINITVTARVIDDPINVDVNLLTNTGTFTYGAGTVLVDDADFEIVEPNLGLAKSFGVVNDLVVPITLTVNNTGGTAPAYDLLLEDVFDTNVWDLAGFSPVSIPTGFVFATNAGPGVNQHTVSITSDSGSSYPDNTIEPNEVLVFTFNAILRDDVTLPTTIANTATLSESSSLPGNDPTERQYPPIVGNDTLLLPELDSLKSDALLIDVGSDGGANPGDTLRYTLTIENTGDGDATQVILTDIPDPNGSLVVGSVTTSLGSVTVGNTAGDTTVEVNVGTLASMTSVTITYDVVVDNPLATGVEQLVNQALIASQQLPDFDSDDPDTGAVDDPTVVPIVAAPDLMVSKDDGGVSVSPAGVVVYTIGYSNAGTQDATGVVITETVPTNTTFNAGNSSPGWVCVPDNTAGSSCTINIGNVNVNDPPATVDFAVTVDASLATGVSQIDNTVSIADDGNNGPDPTPGDNTDTDNTPVDAAPDLSLNKDDGGVTVVPGQVASYTLSYANNGNQTAQGVVITETVPANTTFAAGSSTAGWNCVPGITAGSVCDIAVADLNAGDSGSVIFAVMIDSPLPTAVTEILNSASINDDGNNGPDPTPGDNTDSDNTPVDATPDMAVMKNDGVTTAAAGQLLVYSITYENVGNQQATGVTLTEMVPTHTTFNAANSSAGWICVPDAQAGSLCTLSVGTVDVGVPGMVAFAVDVDDPLSAGAISVVNNVSIADDGTNGVDPNPDNNSDSDVDGLGGNFPDLTVSKEDGGVTVQAGGVVTYTINYSNQGTIGSTGVEITETVPANAVFDAGSSTVGWVCSPDNNAGSTCLFTVGSLAGGENGSVLFAVTVDDPLPAGVDQIDNTVSIADDGNNGPDLNPGDNTDSENTPVDATPNLRVEKVHQNSSVVAGDTLVYDISYENIGTQDATGVVLTETVPVNTEFNAAASTAGWNCSPDISSGSTCTLNIGDVNVGDPVQTVQFAVMVDASVVSGVDTINNTVSIGDDGNNGPDPDTGDNTSTENTPVQAAPDLAVNKTDNGVSSGPGQTVVYQINYENLGNQDATGVMLNEVVPDHTSFNQANSSVTWSCTPDNTAGSTCTYSVGALAVGDSGVVTFAVVVDDPLATGVNQLNNTVTISDDGNNGPDSDLSNNTSIENTGLTSEPPVGLKIGEFDSADSHIIHWTFWWFNPNNPSDLPVFIFDEIPQGTSYVPGSATCTASGVSSCTVPTYNAGLNRIELTAVLGEDMGAPIDATPDMLNNAIIIEFDIRVNQGGSGVIYNQAEANWDNDNDGDATDDATDGQSPVVTDDPVTNPIGDPTGVRYAFAVPTVTFYGLLLLMLTMLGIGYQQQRRR